MSKGKIILKISDTENDEILFEERDGKIYLDGSTEPNFDSRKKFMQSIHGMLVEARKERKIHHAPNTPEYSLLTKDKPESTDKKPAPKRRVNWDSEKMQCEIDALKVEVERLRAENDTLRSAPRTPDAPADVVARLKTASKLSEFGKSLVAFHAKNGYLTERQKFFAEKELERVA